MTNSRFNVKIKTEEGGNSPLSPRNRQGGITTMKIGKDYLGINDTLEIVLKSGETFALPSSAITELDLEVTEGKKGNRNAITGGFIKINETGNLRAVNSKRLSKKLFTILSSHADVAGVDVVGEDKAFYADVPCDPLVSASGKIIECSNCASTTLKNKELTLLLGKDSLAYTRKDNDFGFLPSEPIKRIFGRIPTFENCRVFAIKTFTENRIKKIALTLGVKEYGGRRLPYSIVCSKVKDINIFYEKTDETTPLNVSTLSDGSYYVALPVFGLEFVCAKIEEGK